MNQYHVTMMNLVIETIQEMRKVELTFEQVQKIKENATNISKASNLHDAVKLAEKLII